MAEQRLIDGNALIEKYGDWYTEEGTEEGYIGTIKGIVDSMPTIEPKKGKWIVKEGTVCFHDVCSECEKRFVHTYPHYNFCPNCGARMQEGEEDG